MLAVALLGGYSLVQIAVAIVIIAAICALVTIAMRQFGVAIPPWVIQVFWVVVITVVIILAIKMVGSL